MSSARTFYFLRLTPGAVGGPLIIVPGAKPTIDVDAWPSAQTWAVVATHRNAAYDKLDAVLAKHKAGTLKVDDLTTAKVYPGAPAPATLDQLAAVERLARNDGRDYFFTARGPAIRPRRLAAQTGEAGNINGSLTQPIQSGPTEEAAPVAATHHAHSDNEAETGH